ncbi:MAG: pilus (MSHA type) biogenesis protein MshL [Methylophilaceae bacterium]
MKNTWIIFIVLALAGCAHESRITPSSGHIDGQTDAQQAKSTAAAITGIPKPVTSNVFVPPPKPKAKEQTYSVVVNEVPVKEILFALARESKLNIDIHPAIQGRVTLNAVDQTLPAILERLSKQVDLTYKLEGNVLNITPDMPVLRSYKVDYVNMSRDTTGFIGVAAEISGTGRSASTGASGSSASTSGSTGTASNSSRTQVSSISKHHFWETLIQNIKDILAETDKEVIIGRNDNTAQSEMAVNTAGDYGDAAAASPQPANLGVPRNTVQEREAVRAEYKTLFAATVIANQEAGVISVRGTSKQHEKVQEFLDKVMSSVKRQVLIEATIVEVRLNDGYQAGIDWSRLNNAGNSGFTFQQSFTPSITSSSSNVAASAGLIAGFVNASRNISASISLLKQFGDTKVLSSPKLMVLNNQTAVLKVVDNLVYFTVQSQISQATSLGGQNLQSVTTTANTVPVGVVMSVTPQINDGGAVNINVRPTISSLIRYVPDPNPQILPSINQGIPEIQVREMESMLQINSGNTAVLGGLMQDQIQRNTDKVPGLSDIPGIGRLFTGRNDTSRKTELVIFLRPTVIQNASLESDELQFYRQYLPSQQLEKRISGNGY